MDLNDIRAWHTLILLALFVGVVLWAYSRRQRNRFDEASHLPFEDDAKHQATLDKEQRT